MYEAFFKRLMDFSLSFFALIVLSPVILIFTVIGFFAMGGNPFFFQLRPGRNEKIFRMIKFRTMTNAKDSEGNLLPDSDRLIPYGKFLRSTSLDELPELINILKGDMSIVGPRPLLVEDMLFMSDKQRNRHSVRPGLSGLAQCNGRNNMSWERKLEYDLEYIQNITFWGDWKIIFKTVFKVFLRDGITRDDMATDMNLGDWLLLNGKVDREYYDLRITEAKEMESLHI